MQEPIIGERMRTLRQRQGISQADLARALGASINAINMIERGQVTAPHIKRLMAMADLFEVSLDYLVGLTDDPTPPARRARPGSAAQPHCSGGSTQKGT